VPRMAAHNPQQAQPYASPQAALLYRFYRKLAASRRKSAMRPQHSRKRALIHSYQPDAEFSHQWPRR
jgi:hypothetical protein